MSNHAFLVPAMSSEEIRVHSEAANRIAERVEICDDEGTTAVIPIISMRELVYGPAGCWTVPK